MIHLPRARTANIIVQNLKDETLIYDLVADKAFCLNATSAKIYQACDEKTPVVEVKNKYGFSDEIIYLALDELRKENLLEETSYVSPFAGISRREIIRRVGMASMIALPVISALIAPTAISAASTCVNPGGQAANTTVRTTPGGFAGCYADCSAPAVTARCCNGSARATMIVCDPGPPQRTTCLCN